MDLKEDKIIGIVGGMGPQSGSALFNCITCNTSATMDQLHLSTILMSFPKHIVDRSLFLAGSVPVNPAFNIASVIQKLEQAGASLVGIACNTSYAPEIYNVILDELEKKNCKVKLIHMPFEVCSAIKKSDFSIRRVGLMTTNGTYKSGVYKKLLFELGYEPVVPDFEFQNNTIHKMIYDPEFGVKSNPTTITDEVKLLFDKTLHFFKEQRTDAIILGCTELSLIVREYKIKDMIVLDSIEILANALIREATTQAVENDSNNFLLKQPMELI
jgi:aspartate racemase